MDWNKALSASRRVQEYNSLMTLAVDLASARTTGGDLGTVTVTLPRRYLAPLKSMVEDDMARLQKEVEAL